MAKKQDDNYSWLDNYSTDPRDSVFDDVTQRHRDRVRRNRDRDALDRENDAYNLSWTESGTGLYDDLVFDASPSPTTPAPPAPPATQTAAPPPPPRRKVPPPPAFSQRVATPPVASPPPPPRPERVQRTEPQRLPDLTVPPSSPPVERLPQPVPPPNAEQSLLDRIRKVPRSVFVPIIFGVLFLISSLSNASDESPTIRQAEPVVEAAGTPIVALVPGDCFLAPPGQGSSRVELRGCNQPHGGEVIALTAGEVDEALDACDAARRELDPAALGRLPEDAFFTLLLNGLDSRCVVISPSTSLIGSLVRPG